MITEIDKLQWSKIFPRRPTGIYYDNSKFNQLPRAIPWTMDFDTNIWLTLEWLWREGKKDKIKLYEKDLLNPIRDNWFKVEFEEGFFIHCCYPEELLKFRRQYESLLFNILELDKDPTISRFNQIKETSGVAREMLWSAWKCFGCDGVRTPPKDEDEEGFLSLETLYDDWPRRWNKQCSLCCFPLPKSLQIWVKLQHSKLKEAK